MNPEQFNAFDDWNNSIGKAKAKKICRSIARRPYTEGLEQFLADVHREVCKCGGELMSRQVIALAIVVHERLDDLMQDTLNTGHIRGIRE